MRADGFLDGSPAASRDEPGLGGREIRWVGLGMPALFLALAVIAALAALALWSRTLLAREAVPVTTAVEITLADRTLVVPRAWLIAGEGASRAGRPVARVALEAPLREVLDLDTVPADIGIGITFVPADEAPAPSDRPALLYNRFLAPGADPTADGLVRRAFAAQTPYEGEVLFLAPPQGRAFAARCLDAEAATGVRLPCLAEIRRGGLDVQIRMPRSALGHWSRIVAAVDRLAAPTP